MRAESGPPTAGPTPTSNHVAGRTHLSLSLRLGVSTRAPDTVFDQKQSKDLGDVPRAVGPMRACRGWVAAAFDSGRKISWRAGPGSGPHPPCDTDRRAGLRFKYVAPPPRQGGAVSVAIPCRDQERRLVLRKSELRIKDLLLPLLVVVVVEE